MDIKIFNNAMPKRLFNLFKSRIMSTSMDWHFGPTTYNNDKNFMSFVNIPKLDDRVFAMTEYCFLALLDNINYPHELGMIYRYRYGLILKNNNTSIVHPKHVDGYFEHKTLLLYINDSDGDTFFYDKNGNIIKKITPKENTCVIFDGNIEHSSSTPTKNKYRYALSINFEEIIK